MKEPKRTKPSVSAEDVRQLVDRAARRGLTLDRQSAEALATFETLAAARKLNAALCLIQAARRDCLVLSLRDALKRIETCGGDGEEAIRRMLNGGPEARPGIPESLQYASDRGVRLAPRTVYRLFTRYGAGGTRDYIDKLAAIMDAAAILNIECTQVLASRRLSAAGGSAQQVIADFEAEYRRRSDRRTVICRVVVPPRELRARPNAFAGCGCPRCLGRLAEHMRHYIEKMIAARFFARLDRDEARSEAYLELIRSAETWPGGNFTGWFATRFMNRVKAIYDSPWAWEQRIVSLDAEGVLENEEGGGIPLGERIPDRSVDVLIIVLLRERVAEAELELRQLRAERCEEFLGDASLHSELSQLRELLRLILPDHKAKWDDEDGQAKLGKAA